ncbi:MAG: hypothetical protein KC646_02680 [Candidatus Cloacimonetes bacterium]|nr:hypothetical protein [Candidatus Cloacimonadota bacterium]
MANSDLQKLNSIFLDGKMIDESTFYISFWNQEVFVKTSDEGYQLFINFEFNLDESQNLILNKAKLMGLLGFHYYHPISLNSKAIKLRVLNNPKLKTQFVALAATSNDIKIAIDAFNQCHLDMTMSAIEALNKMNEKHQLI